MLLIITLLTILVALYLAQIFSTLIDLEVDPRSFKSKKEFLLRLLVPYIPVVMIIWKKINQIGKSDDN